MLHLDINRTSFLCEPTHFRDDFPRQLFIDLKDRTSVNELHDITRRRAISLTDVILAV